MIRYQYDPFVPRPYREPDAGLGCELDRSAGIHDFRMTLDAFTRSPKLNMEMWGLFVDALKPEDYYELDRILSRYVQTENKIQGLLRDLDRRADALRRDHPEDVKAYLDSNQRWYQPVIDEQEKNTREARNAGYLGLEYPEYRYDAFVQTEIEYPRDGGNPKRNIPPTIFNGTLQYTARDIPLLELRRVVNSALMLRRQYLILCATSSEELHTVVERNQLEYYYAMLPVWKAQAEADLKAAMEREAKEAAASAERQAKREAHWRALEAEERGESVDDGGAGLAGDVMGAGAGVAGALALIPVLTPIAGPIALVLAAGSLVSHVTSISVKGDWDKPGSFATLGADAFAVVPGIGAVAKGAKTAGSLMSVGKVGLGAASRAGGRAFLSAVAGSSAAEATKLFGYLGNKAAAIGPKVLAGQSANIGKLMQCGTNLALQVPLVLELSSGTDMTTAKDVAGGSAVAVNYGQSIGSWGVVGQGFEKAGTVSLGLFAKIIGRRR